MQSINYTLYWIRLLDKKGRLVYKDPNEYVFDSEEHVLIHINDVKVRYEKMFGLELKISPHYQQTPKEEVIKDVVGFAAIITGTSMKAIRNNKINDRDVTEARKIISGICSDMGLLPSQVNKIAGFDRSGVYAQIDRCNELLEIDENFRRTYNAVKKATLEANGIKIKEDE